MLVLFLLTCLLATAAHASGTVAPSTLALWETSANVNTRDAVPQQSCLKYAKLTYSGTTQVAVVTQAPTQSASGTCRIAYNQNNLNTGYFMQVGVYYAGGTASCPSNSTLGGTTCTCDVGYMPNEGSTACVPYIYVPRAWDPAGGMCKDPGKGNPIFPLRAVKREAVDTGVRLGPLTITLTYDSTALVPRGPAELDIHSGTVVPSLGVLGKMWTSNLFKRVAVPTVRYGSGVWPGAARTSRGDGTVVTMSRDNATGNYVSAAKTADRLVSTGGGAMRYVDTKSNVEEAYDSTGHLTQMTGADGQSVEFVYSDATTPASVAPGPGYLISLTDGRGRVVNLTYVSRPSPLVGAQLSSITDLAGGVISFSYDSVGNVGGIQWPDGKSRTYLYENNSHGALTGIVDESGARYSTFGYDTSLRAISTEHAGGVDRHSTTYTTAPSIQITKQYDGAANVYYLFYDWVVPQGTTVTDPLGAASSWTGTSLFGATYLTGASQPAGSGCAASSKSQSYDANGNIVGKTDFNGRNSCSAYDTGRNLELVRVDGLSGAACSGVLPDAAALPVGARKTSVQWHPDWSLEIKRAEPGRLKTLVYNGLPDPFNGGSIASCAPASALLPDGKPIAVMCRQVEQSTTDADGSQGFGATLQVGVEARQRAWTYDVYGKVLTAQGPRTDVADTTSYAYYTDTTAEHTAGDLQTVVDAAGNVASYPLYNKHGQVLRVVDPNGVATDYTYDLRQRLRTVTIAGQTTTHDYWPVGLLKRTTRPDGSYVDYGYDDSHRLTWVADNLGNRIEYTLDSAGNRIAENTKDPSGVLARQVSRIMDALGRVQQVTGRE